MLKIAHNISNLSDARYFAAAGFDWIIFNFGPGAAEHKHQLYGISEWISGSLLGIHVASVDELEYHLAHHPEIKGFWLDPLIEIDHQLEGIFLFSANTSIKSSETYFISQAINPIADPSDSILDLSNFDPADLDLKDLKMAGITLSGSEEERPGFKSYGNIEDWMSFCKSAI